MPAYSAFIIDEKRLKIRLGDFSEKSSFHKSPEMIYTPCRYTSSSSIEYPAYTECIVSMAKHTDLYGSSIVSMAIHTVTVHVSFPWRNIPTFTAYVLFPWRYIPLLRMYRLLGETYRSLRLMYRFHGKTYRYRVITIPKSDIHH